MPSCRIKPFRLLTTTHHIFCDDFIDEDDPEVDLSNEFDETFHEDVFSEPENIGEEVRPLTPEKEVCQKTQDTTDAAERRAGARGIRTENNISEENDGKLCVQVNGGTRTIRMTTYPTKDKVPGFAAISPEMAFENEQRFVSPIVQAISSERRTSRDRMSGQIIKRPVDNSLLPVSKVSPGAKQQGGVAPSKVPRLYEDTEQGQFDSCGHCPALFSAESQVECHLRGSHDFECQLSCQLCTKFSSLRLFACTEENNTLWGRLPWPRAASALVESATKFGFIE